MIELLSENIAGDTADKLQAVVQLAVAIAVHIGDLESAAQIAIVITLLERVLIAIEHQAPNIPLVVMQRLIGAAINSIVNVSTLVWLPIYGYFHGDHWLRQITSQVTLTFRGNETTEDGLVPFYWILVLPTQLISSLVQGLRTDISTLPMGQANPCMTLFTALAKARHWVRQGHIEPSAELSALVWRPTIASTSAALKTESGRGGQAIGTTFHTLGRAIVALQQPTTMDCGD